MDPWYWEKYSNPVRHGLLDERYEQLLALFVEGSPKTRGSKNFIPLGDKHGGYAHDPETGRPLISVVDSTGTAGKQWMQLVAYRAGEAYGGPIVSRAVIVQVLFWVKRPKNHWKKDGASLSAEGRRHKFPLSRSAGDLDKLLRAVLDGLTGRVYADDSQVVAVWSEKRYHESATFPTGALIRVYVWDPPDGPTLLEAP